MTAFYNSRENDIGLVQAYGRRGWVRGGADGWKVKTTSYLYHKRTVMGGSTTTNRTALAVSRRRFRTGSKTRRSRITARAASRQQPLQQYQGQMVADIWPQMQQAWNLAANPRERGQGAQNAAQAGYLNAHDRRRRSCTRDSSQHQSAAVHEPVHPGVINKTLPIMQQNLALSQNQQQNAANSANAFGGRGKPSSRA